MRVRWHGETVVDIPVDPVAASSPELDRPAREPADLARAPEARPRERRARGATSARRAARAARRRRTSARSAWIYRQYDQLVQGNTVLGPGGDAALVRVKREDGTPTRKALALVGRLQPALRAGSTRYAGTVAAVAEAARNVACTGARPLALTNCLNFGNPEKPEIMWEFARGDRAGSATRPRALGTPVVSGNVSLYNETHGHARSTRRRRSRWSACSTPWRAPRRLALRRPRATRSCCSARRREELGGSEWLALRRGLEARRAAARRPRARAAPAPAARRGRCGERLARHARTTSPTAASRWRSRSAASTGPASASAPRVELADAHAARRAALRRVDRARDRGDAPDAEPLLARAREARRPGARRSARTGGERLRDRGPAGERRGSTSRSTRLRAIWSSARSRAASRRA